jgi:hypothetical protein
LAASSSACRTQPPRTAAHRIEKIAEYRDAVVIRQAEPSDHPVRADDRCSPAIADDAQLGKRRIELRIGAFSRGCVPKLLTGFCVPHHSARAPTFVLSHWRSPATIPQHCPLRLFRQQICGRQLADKPGVREPDSSVGQRSSYGSRDNIDGQTPPTFAGQRAQVATTVTIPRALAGLALAGLAVLFIWLTLRVDLVIFGGVLFGISLRRAAEALSRLQGCRSAGLC